MKKQDIIRIINEEVDIALDEMYDPIYDTMLPEILVMISAGVIGVVKAIKYLKEKGLDKQDIIDVIKKAKSKLNESINEEEELYNVIDRETEKLITDTPIRKSIALRLAAKKKGWIIQKHKESVNETTKHTIVVYNGKRLAVEPGDIERLKSGKDVVGKSLKHAGQEEWIHAKGAGKWKIEESLEATNKEIVKYKGEDHVITRKSGDRIYLRRAEDAVILGKMPEFWVKAVDIKESINENEGMTKSLKDIDSNLSLTTYGTKPPSFKITYRVKDDMSKEMEQELVAWVLSKGGVVESVSNEFDVEDRERYYYPYVKFSYK